MRISGCSAIVTGAASGLGLATARALQTAGATVVMLDLPGSAGADRAAQLNARAPAPDESGPVDGSGDATAAGGRTSPEVVFRSGDVTVEADVQAAIDATTGLAPLRIVVNCAGIAPAARTVGKHGPQPLADFERVLRVNLLGTFNVVRLAAAAMQRTDPVGDPAERGVIVNTASVAAFDGQIGQAAYAASKGGVAAMTLPLAREFARQLIRVVAIAPGLFDTPLLQALPAEARASLGAQVPHPARLGDPAEFAALVGHIVANPMLNGETIRLDGGIRMGPQ
jgi:NAD(P)-dependent dehydrogenase (short-subunit alcohol dehydrogenase family)